MTNLDHNPWARQQQGRPEDYPQDYPLQPIEYPDNYVAPQQYGYPQPNNYPPQTGYAPNAYPLQQPEYDYPQHWNPNAAPQDPSNEKTKGRKALIATGVITGLAGAIVAGTVGIKAFTGRTGESGSNYPGLRDTTSQEAFEGLSESDENTLRTLDFLDQPLERRIDLALPYMREHGEDNIPEDLERMLDNARSKVVEEHEGSEEYLQRKLEAQDEINRLSRWIYATTNIQTPVDQNLANNLQDTTFLSAAGGPNGSQSDSISYSIPKFMGGGRHFHDGKGTIRTAKVVTDASLVNTAEGVAYDTKMRTTKTWLVRIENANAGGGNELEVLLTEVEGDRSGDKTYIIANVREAGSKYTVKDSSLENYLPPEAI